MVESCPAAVDVLHVLGQGVRPAGPVLLGRDQPRAQHLGRVNLSLLLYQLLLKAL